jgi:predicted PurR-regulated permease PerM
MFAWLPFLAADIGSVASGYLTTLYRKWFGCSRVNSVVASSVTGAFMMVSLAFVAITKRSLRGDRTDLDRWLRAPGDLLHAQRAGGGVVR